MFCLAYVQKYSVASVGRLGNEQWVNVLPWTKALDFKAAHPKLWTVNGTEAGSVRAAKGLTFVKVKGAGHMVSLPCLQDRHRAFRLAIAARVFV